MDMEKNYDNVHRSDIHHERIRQKPARPFRCLARDDTRLFDCLVAIFSSAFHKLHPALTKTEKIRILIGIKTDGATYELIQTAKEQQEFVLESHAKSGSACRVKSWANSKNPVTVRTLKMASANSWNGSSRQTGSPRLSIGTPARQALHHDVPRRRPRQRRVITGSSNFTEAACRTIWSSTSS